MALSRIIRGSSRIIVRALEDADGEPISTDVIVSGSVELVQYGRVKATINLAVNGELRKGSDEESLELELVPAVTSALEAAPLLERYILQVNDAAYIAQNGSAVIRLEKEELEIR